MENNPRKYMLAIKRGNNNYLPLEWNLLSMYNGEDMFSLEGIDKFTSNTTHLDIINDVLANHLASSNEKYDGFSIIYYENKKIREVREGVIFSSEKHLLDSEYFIDFIISNLGNKNMINNVINIGNSKNASNELIKFLFFLKNVEFYKEKNDKLKALLMSLFNDISYEERRRFSLNIEDRIIYKLNDKDNKLLRKNIA